MASSASDYLANAAIDASLGTAAFPAIAGLYLGFFTEDPGFDGSGAEASGFGYARQLVTFNSAINRKALLATNVSLTPSGGNWGTLTNWGLFDALTVGNLLHKGQFQFGKATSDGVAVTVDAGAIEIEMPQINA